MLRQYFNCNERLEIFLICFCNILCYVGRFLENKYAKKKITFQPITVFCLLNFNSILPINMLLQKNFMHFTARTSKNFMKFSFSVLR